MKMTPKRPVLALFLILAVAPTLHAANQRLLAYYYYGDKTSAIPYNASNIPYTQLTHIIHANISPAPQGDGTLGIPTTFLEPALIANAHKAGVKVEVSLAGPEYLIAKIAADATLRDTFAQNLANFVIANQYDGLDFDYEVPNDQTEALNFTLLIQAVRTLLPAGQYLISAAVSSSPGSYGVYDFPGMIPLLDFFNVMTYDFHGPWTNHEQINLGTAFYGYGFDVDGLWYFCGCENTISLNYQQIEAIVAAGGWTQYTDSLAEAPYLISSTPNHVGFITYDTPASTALKVGYALTTRGLGGVFMWELSQDYNGQQQPLMNAMYNAAHASAAARASSHQP